MSFQPLVLWPLEAGIKVKVIQKCIILKKKNFLNFLEYCRIIHIISGFMDNTSTHTHTHTYTYIHAYINTYMHRYTYMMDYFLEGAFKYIVSYWKYTIHILKSGKFAN